MNKIINSQETTDRINKEVVIYFRNNGISYQKAAEMLGTTRQVVYNKLSKRPFGSAVARKYATVFGFNEEFLRTGKGRLIERGGGYQKIIRENEQLKAIVRLLKNQVEDLKKQIGITS